MSYWYPMGFLVVIAALFVRGLFVETDEDRRRRQIMKLTGGADRGKSAQAVEFISRAFGETEAGLYKLVSQLRRVDSLLYELVAALQKSDPQEASPAVEAAARSLDETKARLEEFVKKREEQTLRQTEFVDALLKPDGPETDLRVEALGRCPEEALNDAPRLLSASPTIKEFRTRLHDVIDAFWDTDPKKARAATEEMEWCDKHARPAIFALLSSIDDRTKSPLGLVDQLRGGQPLPAALTLMSRTAVAKDAVPALELMISIRISLIGKLIELFHSNPRKAGPAASAISWPWSVCTMDDGRASAWPRSATARARRPRLPRTSSRPPTWRCTTPNATAGTGSPTRKTSSAPCSCSPALRNRRPTAGPTPPPTHASATSEPTRLRRARRNVAHAARTSC